MSQEMIPDNIVVPRFATERQEADWWYEHREEHGEIMAKAMAEGRTRRLVDFLAERGLPLDRIREVAVSVEPGDLAFAAARSQECGMKVGEFLGRVLHEALAKQIAP